MENRERSQLVHALVTAAEEAGGIILEHYTADVEVREKSDRSPVTAADEAAERHLLAALGELTPEVPAVAEERVEAGEVPDIRGGPFWLVDPLDGTREFLSRNGEFTVNIALIEEGAPTLGVVHVPARDESYWSDGENGAWRRRAGIESRIAVREPDTSGLVVTVSRSHRDAKTDALIARLTVRELLPAGSALKLCRIAEGRADLYPRFGGTREWDTAAGDAVLRAAGGAVTTLDGAPLRYGKSGFVNPPFVARGRFPLPPEVRAESP